MSTTQEIGGADDDAVRSSSSSSIAVPEYIACSKNVTVKKCLC